jgi:hypothetical protein
MDGLNAFVKPSTMNCGLPWTQRLANDFRKLELRRFTVAATPNRASRQASPA